MGEFIIIISSSSNSIIIIIIVVVVIAIVIVIVIVIVVVFIFVVVVRVIIVITNLLQPNENYSWQHSEHIRESGSNGEHKTYASPGKLGPHTFRTLSKDPLLSCNLIFRPYQAVV